MITRHMRTHIRIEETHAPYFELQLPISKLSLNQSPTPDSLNCLRKSGSVSPSVSNHLIPSLLKPSHLFYIPAIKTLTTSINNDNTINELTSDSQTNNNIQLKLTNKNNFKKNNNNSDNCVEIISTKKTTKKKNKNEKNLIHSTFKNSLFTNNPFLVGVSNNLSNSGVKLDVNTTNIENNLNALSALLIHQQSFLTKVPPTQLALNSLDQKQAISFHLQNLQQQQQQSEINAAASKLFSTAMAKIVDANQLNQQQQKLMFSSLDASLDGNY